MQVQYKKKERCCTRVYTACLAILPGVPLPLSLDRTVRQRGPNLGLTLPLSLVLALVVLSDSGSLLLQHHTQVSPGSAQNVDLALCAVLGQPSVRASADPCLVNVHGCRILHGVSFAVLEANVDRLGGVGNGRLANTHTTGDNSLIASVLEVFENGDGGLFLAEAQLDYSVVDGLSGNLAGNGAQLLDTRLDVLALADTFSLSALDEHFLIQTTALANVADGHLTLPSLACNWVGVEDGGHGTKVATAGFGPRHLLLLVVALLYLAFAFENGGFGEVTALQGVGALLLRLLLEVLVQNGVGR